jgi:hypothetical protein
LLHRIVVFFGLRPDLGQFLPPSLVTAKEELASTPDAKAHNRYASSD